VTIGDDTVYEIFPEIVIEDVSRLTEVPAEDILSVRKDREIVIARWVVYEVLFSAGYTITDIARLTKLKEKTIRASRSSPRYEELFERPLWRWAVNNIKERATEDAMMRKLKEAKRGHGD
jgi:hypothetical protein